MDYQAPERDAQFIMHDLFQVESVWSEIPQLQDISPDVVNAVLAEAGRLASEVMLPVNQSGDAEGCRWKDGEVTTPAGFKEAFKQMADGG